MRTLTRCSDEKLVPNGIPCVALLHNECHLLTDFLSHYRQLGPISFLIVDDYSTDESLRLLLNQPDVTVFRPKIPTNYATHKAQWRAELLDVYSPNQWCLVPDIDEHLVYLDVEKRSILELILDLERNKSAALLAIMVDMYNDLPLSQHWYEGGGLKRIFPFFDGPRASPFGYCAVTQGRTHRSKFPTPGLYALGGLRWRMFFSDDNDPGREGIEVSIAELLPD